MFANYVKIRKQLEVYQHGLVEFRPETNGSRRSPSSRTRASIRATIRAVIRSFTETGASSIFTTPTRIP